MQNTKAVALLRQIEVLRCFHVNMRNNELIFKERIGSLAEKVGVLNAQISSAASLTLVCNYIILCSST